MTLALILCKEDFFTGDLSLGQTQGTVSVLNALSVAGDLSLNGGTLANSGGTLTWNGASPYFFQAATICT